MVKRHIISFSNAFTGLRYALLTQPNFLVHFILSFFAVLLGIISRLSSSEWAMLFVVIGLGLAIELINTAIESVVDLVTDQWHKNAKIAKDTSAAAMLVYAIFSVIFALFLFLPKFF